MKVFFDDSEFDAQFARTVGKSVVGMADSLGPDYLLLPPLEPLLRRAGGTQQQ
jgi:hypothetical protein